MSTPSTAITGCLHCGSAVPEGSRLGAFCCAGCQTVYGLLREEGLTRYYDLAGGATAPVAENAGDGEPHVLDVEASAGVEVYSFTFG